MTMPSLPMDAVADSLRELSAEIVLPRFRNLQSVDVQEKSPGDLVTVADLEMEAALSRHLLALIPGSTVVGEEACAANPGLLNSVAAGWVWVVDPVDGTINFAQGREHFATMVALLHGGEAVAAWIFQPVTDRLFAAEKGAGALVDGDPTEMAPQHGGPLQGMVSTRYVPVPFRDTVARVDRDLATLEEGRASGIDYPALVSGDFDFLFYWRIFPWDHVPGSLIVTEAGGHVARLDGTPYRASDLQPGLLVAASEATWTAARKLLPN